MKRIGKSLLCILLVCALLVGNAMAETSKGAQKKVPLLSGMFVAPELCTGEHPWEVADWEQALEEMKAIGMDKVIIQYAVQYYSDNYKVHYYTPEFEEPQSDNTGKAQQIPNALLAAKKVGMKVYLGLELAEDPWFSAMAAGFENEEFLKSSATYTTAIFDDLWKQFGGEYGDVIEGWYLPFEYNNSEVSGQSKDRLINRFYVPVTNHIKKVTPKKTIMVSPLVYAPLTGDPDKKQVENWYQLSYDIWTKTKVDIIAPQDGCGWESMVKETLAPWYEALARAVKKAKAVGRKEAQAWNNAECYNMNGTGTMTIKRLTDNMAAVDSYVSQHISFSVASLLYLDEERDGVNPCNRYYYEAYLYAAKNGVLYTTGKSGVPAPEQAKGEIKDGVNASLSWERIDESSVQMPIAGYYIFRREGETYKRFKEVPQTEEKTVTVTDYNLIPGRKYEYQIYAFDATGNMSEKPAELSVETVKDTAVFNRETGTEITDITVSVAEGTNSKIQFGKPSRLTDRKAGGKVKDIGQDNGSILCFGKKEEKKLGSAVLEVKRKEAGKVGFINLQLLYQPTRDIYLPERLDVLCGDEILLTVYPQREYGTSIPGNVWIPLDFGTVVETDAITVKMLMKSPYVAVSEVKLYTADEIPCEGYREPENKIAGRPVMITNYTTEQNFTPDAHFGGVSVSAIDYGKGTIDTNYLMLKECYSTELLTRGAMNAPMLRWTEDGERSYWLSITNIGATYELKVDLPAPTTIDAVETVWMYDRDATVYLPAKIEYYGTTLSGQNELIGTSYPPSVQLIDFDQPTSEENQHIISAESYRVMNASKDTVYRQVTAKVYPEYPANTQFISHFSVY